MRAKVLQNMLWLLLLSLQAGQTKAGDLAVSLLGSDGAPVPYAVLSVEGASELRRVRPEAQAAVDQRDRRFVPFVSLVAPGEQVRFPNSDDTRHSVYSFSEGNAFELQLYRSGNAPPVTMRERGLVTLGCNIHDSMKAYILVTEDGSAVVADESGHARVTSTALEAGAALAVWHPQLEQTLRFTVPQSAFEADEPWLITLPVSWHDPQVGKTVGELEDLLRAFGDDAR